MRLTISSPIIEDRDDGISLCYPASQLAEPQVEFQISGADRSFIPNSLEPALIAAVIPAMVMGRDIELNGPISDELIFRIQHYVIPLLQQVLAGTHPIEIHADQRIRKSSTGQPSILAGLSNGTDSLHLCSTHLGSSVPTEMRVTHFLFHDAGSHFTEELTTKRLAQVRASALFMQRPLAFVRTNLDRLFNQLGLSYQQTHTVRGAAVAFSLSGRVTRFLYASGIARTAVKKTKDIASVDAILLPLLKSETLDCFSAGAAKSRVEKLSAICETEVARRFLDVCVRRSPNCGRCWKCARCLLTLELLGNKAAFEHLFNEDAFQKIRSGYIAHTLVSAGRNEINREVRDLMRARGFQPTLRQKLTALLSYPIFCAAHIPRVGPGLRKLYKSITGFSAQH